MIKGKDVYVWTIKNKDTDEVWEIITHEEIRSEYVENQLPDSSYYIDECNTYLGKYGLNKFFIFQKLTTMNTDKALDLIKKSIEDLLDDISHGRDPWMEPVELAEEKQIDDEMVFEYIYKNENTMFRLLVGDENVDEFTELIIDVLNSEWYSEVYHSKVQEVRIGLEDQADWERTKKSLMPKWRP